MISVVLLIEPEGLAGIGRRLTRLVQLRFARGGPLPVPGRPVEAPVPLLAGVTGGPVATRGEAGTRFATSWAERVEARGEDDPHLFACSGINKE